MRYSVFKVGSSYYGTPIDQVQEFDFEFKMSPVPFSDPRIEGVSSLRGRIITFINLRKCLDVDNQGLPKRRKMVVLDTQRLCKVYETFDPRFGKDLIGVVVDRIEGIVDLDINVKKSEIDQINKASYIEGVVNYQESSVLNLLSFPAIIKDIYKV